MMDITVNLLRVGIVLVGVAGTTSLVIIIFWLLREWSRKGWEGPTADYTNIDRERDFEARCLTCGKQLDISLYVSSQQMLILSIAELCKKHPNGSAILWPQQAVRSDIVRVEYDEQYYASVSGSPSPSAGPDEDPWNIPKKKF